MKLLAVVAIGVIGLTGSPAMSDSKPVYPFKTIQCSEIAEASANSYRVHLDTKKTASEARAEASVKQDQKLMESSLLFSNVSKESILKATQMATIYAAFCK